MCLLESLNPEPSRGHRADTSLKLEVQVIYFLSSPAESTTLCSRPGQTKTVSPTLCQTSGYFLRDVSLIKNKSLFSRGVKEASADGGQSNLEPNRFVSVTMLK